MCAAQLLNMLDFVDHVCYGCFISALVGVLLPELVVSIVLLLTIDAGLMQETGSIPLLAGLLEHLDRFNHLAPGHERDDNEDLAWPGIMGKTPAVSCVPEGDLL